MAKREYAPRRDGDPDVAAMLRRRRRMLGLTTEQAARQARCSMSMWSQLEHATRRPSIVMAEAIADALQLQGYDRDLLIGTSLRGVGRDSPYKLAAELRRRGRR